MKTTPMCCTREVQSYFIHNMVYTLFRTIHFRTVYPRWRVMPSANTVCVEISQLAAGYYIFTVPVWEHLNSTKAGRTLLSQSLTILKRLGVTHQPTGSSRFFMGWKMGLTFKDCVATMSTTKQQFKGKQTCYLLWGNHVLCHIDIYTYSCTPCCPLMLIPSSQTKTCNKDK